MRLFRPPPEFADPAQRRTARIVYSVVGIVMALALGFLLIAVLFLHEDTTHWVYSIGLGSAACLAILELNSRGQVRAAGILLVATLWALFTGFAALGGGILAPVTSGYLVLIFLAGFLLDARAVWWTAALCGATCLAFFAANYAGWLPPGTEHHTAQTHGAILALMMLIVLGLQHLAARNVAARAASEAAVRASEDKFRALFAAMHNVVLVLDGDGRVLEIAPTNPDPLYRPPPEWLGKTLAEVLPPEAGRPFHRADPPRSGRRPAARLRLQSPPRRPRLVVYGHAVAVAPRPAAAGRPRYHRPQTGRRGAPARPGRPRTTRASPHPRAEPHQLRADRRSHRTRRRRKPPARLRRRPARHGVHRRHRGAFRRNPHRHESVARHRARGPAGPPAFRVLRRRPRRGVSSRDPARA
jgi:PAS domain-containing protein